MSRAVLGACLPWLGLLAVGLLVLWLLVRLNRARLDWGRLRALHADQEGSAQSLSFVLTLPLFIMVVLFIVQVSQLMIGTVVVHYAAFAAARSATVWIPQQLADGEMENAIPWYAPDPEAPDQHFPILDPTDPNYGPAEGGVTYRIQPQSLKYQKIASAAVMACMPVSPSRDVGIALPGQGAAVSNILQSAYTALAPGARGNQVALRRIQNKLAYSAENTAVEIRFFHANSEPPLVPYLIEGDIQEFRAGQELGWQDHITVKVSHQLALLPGVGRLLARPAPKPNGDPDEVSPKVARQQNYYTYPLEATATLGNEGEKSVLPYVYPVF